MDNAGAGGLLPSLQLNELLGELQGELRRRTEADREVEARLDGIIRAASEIAVENARLYEESQRQQKWLRASAELTMRLLSGESSHSVLSALVGQALELSGADIVQLAIPDEEHGRLTIDFAEGDGADDVRGLVVPVEDSLSGLVLASGEPIAIDDFGSDGRAAAVTRRALPDLGPAIAFPLGVPGSVGGVCVVARRRGRPPFPSADIGMFGAFGAQAAVALELAGRREDAEQLTVLEDRDRIARDLHDLVIQRLYATGMSLEGAVPMTGRREVSDRIRHAVDAMDDTIKDIRATIYSLQARATHDEPRLRADIVALTDEMTEALGFAPALRLGSDLDTRPVGELSEQVLAVLREALSNAARHAHATRVDVTVDTDDGHWLTLLVRDNGSGPSPAASGAVTAAGASEADGAGRADGAGSRRRRGLTNMASRAEKLGGTFQLTSAEGGGTQAEWRVPIPEESFTSDYRSRRAAPAARGRYPLR